MQTLRLLRDEPALVLLLMFWRCIYPVMRWLWIR